MTTRARDGTEKVGTTTAGQILNKHPGTVLALAKAGKIPAEFTDRGRAIFVRANLERIAAAPPASQAGGR